MAVARSALSSWAVAAIKKSTMAERPELSRCRSRATQHVDENGRVEQDHRSGAFVDHASTLAFDGAQIGNVVRALREIRGGAGCGLDGGSQAGEGAFVARGGVEATVDRFAVQG